ncbi:hypothetical protein [Microcystis sp.]|uniref:hypothetical protein n=1 Tax=Microcystis sp. TaxID=1127 RepID=UPI00391CEE14
MNSYQLFSYQESGVRSQKAALFSPHPTPHTPHPPCPPDVGGVWGGHTPHPTSLSPNPIPFLLNQ